MGSNCVWYSACRRRRRTFDSILKQATPMRTKTRIFHAASLSTVIALASSAAAQVSTPRTSLHVTPYAGYMVFGDYLKGPLGTSLTNAPGPIYGAQLGL